jgi:hypothetical protein
MEINGNEKAQKSPLFFECKICDYNTCIKKDYIRHESTRKHQKWINSSKNEINGNNLCCKKPKKAQKSPKAYQSEKIVCDECKKEYKTNSGLWKHSKKCFVKKSTKDINDTNNTNEIINEIILNTNENNNENTNKLILSLIQQNKEFKELILEQHQQLLVATKENKQIINNTTNNNFNLNVFLNETCKDALNMMEFVKSMNLQLIDLEETGKLGYSGGMSRIFINGLKGLDINKRPIHCSDLKREVLYIKEDNVWEKDNDERTKIKKAIREIEHKNIKQIPLFVKEHPNCIIGSNKENVPYLKMVMQCTGGIQSEEETNINKIITSIAKEVIINKQ